MEAEPVINVARWLPRSSVNGPGERFVLWVQGCPLHCPGCWNPDTWSHAPRQLMAVAEIADMIAKSGTLDGVTFTGGEPFAQATALADLAEQLRAHDLSIMAFTGYELAELSGQAQQRLLCLLDIVVTGRFVRHLKTDHLLWRGSSNQQVHLLSARHANLSLVYENHPVAEVILDDTGQGAVTGFPDATVLHQLGFRD